MTKFTPPSAILILLLAALSSADLIPFFQLNVPIDGRRFWHDGRQSILEPIKQDDGPPPPTSSSTQTSTISTASSSKTTTSQPTTTSPTTGTTSSVTGTTSRSTGSTSTPVTGTQLQWTSSTSQATRSTSQGTGTTSQATGSTISSGPTTTPVTASTSTTWNSTVLVSTGATTKSAFCFHAESRVQTLDDGVITLATLATSGTHPKVLTVAENGKLVYSPIKYWLHANADMDAEFFDVIVDGNHQTLTLTADHILYRASDGRREAILAKEAEVGDFLFAHVAPGTVEPRQIHSISRSKKRGVYAPVTAEGTILVDNVLASCFTNLENAEHVQHYFLDLLFKWQTFIREVLPQNWLFAVGESVSHETPRLALKLLDIAKSIIL